MNLRGRVQNGVIVLENGPALPEGAEVTILCASTPQAASPGPRRRVSLPLAPSQRPGERALTADRIAELLDDDNVSA